MSPEPDYECKVGPVLIRRWGRFVRVNLARRRYPSGRWDWSESWSFAFGGRSR